MIGQYKLYAVLAALGATIALLGGLWYQHGQIVRLRASLAAAEASVRSNEAAAAAKAKELARLRKQHAKQSKELADALKANPDWADSRVPDAVYDSLFPNQDQATR